MSPTELAWRAMAPDDIDGVVRVAAEGFPEHPEDRTCFAERLSLSPDLCFVLAAQDGAVRGYLIAYPWREGVVPPLNSLIGAVSQDHSNIYLHDLALDRTVAGGGHARAAVAQLVDRAQALGAAQITLVSVNRSAAFWQAMGFTPADAPGLAAKLASYGEGAVYMARSIRPA
jgi:ribosomal protein S18 acetylase RimI-like enzyme